MGQLGRPTFSYAEYAELEAISVVKHEFLDGSVWALPSSSPAHSNIVSNAARLLTGALRGRPCRVFSSDLRVRVPETGLATYPDITVIWGKIEVDPEDPKRQSVIGPRVVVEVLAPTTAAYDRGEKLAHYMRSSSLKEIVHIAMDEPRLELWHREGDRFSLEVVRGTETALLRSLTVELALSEVYREAPAEAPSAPA